MISEFGINMTNKEKKNYLDCQVRIWYQGTGNVDSDSVNEILYDYCGITRNLDIIISRGLGKIVTTEVTLSYYSMKYRVILVCCAITTITVIITVISTLH